MQQVSIQVLNMLFCVWEVLAITAAETEMREVFLIEFSSRKTKITWRL